MALDDGMCPASPSHQVGQIRKVLKEWEKAFAVANNGRKAGREDIKKHHSIAQTYKEYNRLCGRQLPRTSRALLPSTPTAKKHRLSQVDSRKGPKYAHSSHPAEIDPYDSPLHQTPIALRTSIAPTPQKNGQVLGLFDLLSPPTIKVSPSRPSHPAQDALDLQATPSKRKAIDLASAHMVTPRNECQTPQRSSVVKDTKKFLTPTALRFNGRLTPGSRKTKYDSTPEFLRRESQRYKGIPLSSLDESAGEQAEVTSVSPLTVRMPPKPAGKSLSALVQGLKSTEEEKLDEELDILREMEAEEAGLTPNLIPNKPRILVQDSQLASTIDAPLGADGEFLNSEDEEHQLDGIGLDGKPTKVWKKKGQKRTTRKANIKPSTAKWKPEPAWEPGKENENGDETSQVASKQHLPPGDLDDNAGNDNTKSTIVAGNKSVKSSKVGAVAHANFRALKLRNKAGAGSKKSRFRRKH